MLKQLIDVHYGCGNQSQMVYSLNHDIMASLPLNSHPELPKSDPNSAVQQCKGALICLGTSLKCAKKKLNVHYGYEKQSKVVISLNHDIMASFPLVSHPELPKSDLASAVLWCKGALICLRTSLKGGETLYICPK
jgi:hypothetical protein